MKTSATGVLLISNYALKKKKHQIVLACLHVCNYGIYTVLSNCATNSCSIVTEIQLHLLI